MKKMINKGSIGLISGVALALFVSGGSLQGAQPGLQRARSMSLPAATGVSMVSQPASGQPLGGMAGARFGISPTQQKALRSLKPRGLMPAFRNIPATDLDIDPNSPYFAPSHPGRVVPTDYRQRFLALSPELQQVGTVFSRGESICRGARASATKSNDGGGWRRQVSSIYANKRFLSRSRRSI